MKHFISKSATLFAVLTLSTSAFAAKGSTARGVGAGLTFPSSHQSLVVNSSTLNEADKLSLQGLYGLKTEEFAASLVGSQKSFGWGVGWSDNGTGNAFDGGVGLNLGGLMLGTNLYTNDFNGLNGDVSLTIDLSSLRLVTAFRGIDNGIDRFDVGLGFNVDMLLVSLDMFKYLPWSSSDYYGFDASFAYNAGKMAFGMGYDFSYFNGIKNGNLHADISVSVTNRLAFEGHYRLTPNQSTSIPDFSVGARLIF